MSRQEKKAYEAELNKIMKKAKKDMADWISTLPYTPSKGEMEVWQSGYVYGLNRGYNDAIH